MKKEQVQAAIADFFRGKVQKDQYIRNAYLRVHSEKLGIDLSLAEGSTSGMPAHADQPYYIASISKLFAAVLVGILVEQERLSFEDPISLYVEPDILHNLHRYKGVDYTQEIRIKHLLSHTSGLHDFMEDRPQHGKPMTDLIFDQPNRDWTPRGVLHWAKEHLTPHFPPGKGFHYSDTGYHLLGLIVESVTELPYHEALRAYIFEPCGMVHSSFAHRSEAMVKSEYPLARLYGRNSIDITEYRSLTIMFAGGGVISTTADLLAFMKALVQQEILREDTMERMREWSKFFVGMEYGYGLMRIKTVPLLMPKRYNAWGNAGSTGTFLFYHPATDSYLIGALNQFRYHAKAIRMMLRIVDKVVRGEG